MKTYKTLVSAVVLAGAALGSQAALADDISEAPEAIVLDGGTSFFGALFTGNNAGNTFMDQYSFTATSASTFSADLLSFSGVAKNGLDITGFDLYSSTGLLLGGAQLSTGASDMWSLSGPTLAAGDYYLQVTGTVMSQAAGKYYADVALAPVPEPETYAMMLGGLGLLGFMARRRKAAPKA